MSLNHFLCPIEDSFELYIPEQIIVSLFLQFYWDVIEIWKHSQASPQ